MPSFSVISAVVSHSEMYQKSRPLDQLSDSICLLLGGFPDAQVFESVDTHTRS